MNTVNQLNASLTQSRRAAAAADRASSSSLLRAVEASQHEWGPVERLINALSIAYFRAVERTASEQELELLFAYGLDVRGPWTAWLQEETRRREARQRNPLKKLGRWLRGGGAKGAKKGKRPAVPLPRENSFNAKVSAMHLGVKAHGGKRAASSPRGSPRGSPRQAFRQHSRLGKAKGKGKARAVDTAHEAEVEGPPPPRRDCWTGPAAEGSS